MPLYALINRTLEKRSTPTSHALFDVCYDSSEMLDSARFKIDVASVLPTAPRLPPRGLFDRCFSLPSPGPSVSKVFSCDAVTVVCNHRRSIMSTKGTRQIEKELDEIGEK